MSNLSTAPTTTAHRTGTPDPHLHGRWLLIARVSWVVLTLLLLTLNLVMLPRYDALLQAHCQPGPQCFANQLTAYDRLLLHQLGLSLGFLAAYQVMLDVVSVLVCCALGALLFWRKSADRMALLCAFVLVLFGGAGYTNIIQGTLAPVSSAWFALISTLDLLGQSSFLIFFLLFPSGRFVPRWTRWVALCVVLYWIYTIFLSSSLYSQSSWSNLVFFALLLCVVVRRSTATDACPRPESASRPNGSSLASPSASLALCWSSSFGTPLPLQHCSNRMYSRRW